MSMREIVVKDPETGLNSFLVIDSLRNGRACGGIRIVPDASIEEARILSQVMGNKYALFNFSQTGGAKAVVSVPRNSSKEQRNRILARFGKGIQKELRSRTFIPWTCLGSTADDVRTVLKAAGARMYNLDDSASATAWSTYGSILGAADALGLNIKDCSVAIQGMGNVGGVLAKLIAQAGGKVVGISTYDGALYDPKGLDVEELLRLRSKHGPGFVKKTEYRQIQRDSLLELPVTFLVPCARQHAITEKTRVKAKAIIPSSNAPYTPNAPEVLAKKGVLCLPSDFCFSGGHIGPRLVLYGYSENDARKRTIVTWRSIVHDLILQSKRANVLPTDFAKHMLKLKWRMMSRNSSTAQIFEHALRSKAVPLWMRRLGGGWYARSRFADFRDRMRKTEKHFISSYASSGRISGR